MATVGEIDMHVQGDVGGIGVSRFRFVRSDDGPITPADAAAAGAAVHGLYSTSLNMFPSIVSLIIQAVVNTYDSGSGLIQGTVNMGTVPGAMVGTNSNSYGAGLGARLNWKTSTISGRRMLKGCSYWIPLCAAAFGTTGAVQPGQVTTMDTAAAGYLSAMATANLQAVIWHRPKKGATVGGLIGPITAHQASSTPAGLRSRRS